MVRATNESDGLAWRSFASLESSVDPQLVIGYNTPPSVPAPLSPAAEASGDCTPTLSASFSDAEGGEGRVAFHVLDSAGNLVVGDWADSVNGEAKWQVPRNADGSCKLSAEDVRIVVELARRSSADGQTVTGSTFSGRFTSFGAAASSA